MLVAGVALGCAACGDDAKPSTAGSSGVPATSCLAGVSDEDTAVVIKVDDIVSGFGSIGSRSPRPTAGPVRIEVRADAENRGPVSVTLHRSTADGAAVTEITGVRAGTSCAVQVDLAAGTYVATADLNPGQTTTFDVGA